MARTKQSSKRDERPDALKLLKEDHDEVRSLFERFDDAGERAHKTKAKIVRQLIEELARHSAIRCAGPGRRRRLAHTRARPTNRRPTSPPERPPPWSTGAGTWFATS